MSAAVSGKNRNVAGRRRWIARTAAAPESYELAPEAQDRPSWTEPPREDPEFPGASGDDVACSLRPCAINQRSRKAAPRCGIEPAARVGQAV